MGTMIVGSFRLPPQTFEVEVNDDPVMQRLVVQALFQTIIQRLVAQQLMRTFLVAPLFSFQPNQSFIRRDFVPQQRFPIVPSYRPSAPVYRPTVFEDGDRFTNYVQQHNQEVRERARMTNQDGGAFLKAIVAKQDSTFKAMFEEQNPEVFVPTGLPGFAVNELISSKERLTVQNTPKFAHKHLAELEELRNDPSNKNLKDKIATEFSREPDFIAAMQNASYTIRRE